MRALKKIYETLKKRERKKGGSKGNPFFAINDDIVNLYGNTIFKTRDAQVFTRRGTEDPPEDEDAVLSSPRRVVVVALFDVVLAVCVGVLHDTLVARGKRIFTRNCDSRDTTQLEKSCTFEETNNNGAREFTRREYE